MKGYLRCLIVSLILDRNKEWDAKYRYRSVLGHGGKR